MGAPALRIPLKSQSLALTGAQTWDFKKLKARDSSGIHYIDRIEFLVIITAITQGGGAAAAPRDLHNILSGVIVEANDGDAWGPNNVNAQTIDESRYQATGMALPYAGDIAGDANVAAGAGPVTRSFRVVWDYNAYGRPGTYTPPAVFFKAAGSISITITPPGSNVTLTGTIQPIVYTHGEAKMRAVPRITLRGNKINALDFQFPGNGMCLQMGLEKTTAWAAADMTNISVQADDMALLTQDPVLYERADDYNENPEVTACYLLRHFMDPVGGTYPYAIPVFPPEPTTAGIAALPTADAYTAKIVGAVDPTLVTAYTVIVDPLDKSFASLQLQAQGAEKGATAMTAHDVPGGVVHNDRIANYVGLVLQTPAAVKG